MTTILLGEFCVVLIEVSEDFELQGVWIEMTGEKRPN